MVETIPTRLDGEKIPGVGALGGGDVSLLASHNVINVDAFVPTNARMASRDANGTAIGPDPSKLAELGGGDLVVRAGKYARRVNLPHVLGVDPSGVITKVGVDVTDRKVGHRRRLEKSS